MKKMKFESVHENAVNLVNSLHDLPHLRGDGKWRTESSPAGEERPGYLRLVFYAETVLALGMSRDDVRFMFGDLYWDAYSECESGGKLQASA